MSVASSTVFCDRIINIAITGPLARIDFGTLAPPTEEGGNPSFNPSHQMVMPVEGLVASMGMLDAVIKKLVADGVLVARPPAATQQ